MPGKKLSYECIFCRTEYKNWEEAEECEKIHKIPVIVADPIYKKSAYKAVKEYPESVFVAFNDGEVLQYYKKRI